MHITQKQHNTPIPQFLFIIHIFPVISYIFINILSYKNLYPIPLRILYLHIMFVFDIFTFNIFAFDIFPFDIFPFDIFPFDIFSFDIFTIQIHFYNIPKNPQMCPARRDLPPPPPTLTLGSTFHIQYRSIQTQVSKTPTLHNQALKKSPRGVQRGRGFAAPLRFSYFRKKILRPFANPNETQYFSKVFFYILLLHNTHPIHSLNLLEFI